MGTWQRACSGSRRACAQGRPRRTPTRRTCAAGAAWSGRRRRAATPGRGRTRPRAACRLLWAMVRPEPGLGGFGLHACCVGHDQRHAGLASPACCCCCCCLSLADDRRPARRAGPFRFRSTGRRPLEPAAANEQVCTLVPIATGKQCPRLSGALWTLCDRRGLYVWLSSLPRCTAVSPLPGATSREGSVSPTSHASFSDCG